MTLKIVKQPDGLYSCWSTEANCFLFRDATREEYIEKIANGEYVRKKEELKNEFDGFEDENFSVYFDLILAGHIGGEWIGAPPGHIDPRKENDLLISQDAEKLAGIVLENYVIKPDGEI